MPAGIPRSKRRGNGRTRPGPAPATVDTVLAELFGAPLDPKAPEPLFAQIASRLRHAIQTYKLLPGERLPSEPEICRFLGVSRNTVMRAVNTLRAEGLLYRERGSGTYVRDLPAAQGRTPLRFGIVSPTSRLSMFDLYLGGILSGLSGTLQELDAVAVLGSPSVNPSSDYFTEITRRDIDGFIVITPSPRDRGAVAVLAKNHVPFVVVGADFDQAWDAVTTDNRLGMRLALRHLWDLGHRRIGLVAAPDYDYDSAERWEGFLQTWTAEGPEGVQPLLLRLTEIGRWEDEIQSALADWLRLSSPPTAIITAGLTITTAALHTLRCLGVRIPEDVSLVGYDDYTLMEYLSPPLTTIRQPLAALGATAARLLAAKVRGQVPTAVHHVLPVELVVRGSTAPPPSAHGLSQRRSIMMP